MPFLAPSGQRLLRFAPLVLTAMQVTACRSAAKAVSPRTTPAERACSSPDACNHRTPSKAAASTNDAPRNIIFMLSDGTALEAWTLARWVKGEPLHVDAILTGAVRTYGTDSLVTDSAPGASAYATGRKGSDKAVAVGAWSTTLAHVPTAPELAYVPLATVLEGARLLGCATGMIATSNIQHATPAAFSAHVADRNLYEEIAEQQVYQNLDVVLSGGAQYLLPQTTPGGTRLDGENLVEVLQQRGYRYVTTRQELTAQKTGRVWGAFAPNDLAYEIDRPRFAPHQPSLAEMTEYAIDNLANSARGKKRGFFLFVEGSKVDWAAHANDPVGVVSDLLAFDAAVGHALRFAKSNQNTQVIVVADHGTGGLTIGTANDPHYSRTDDDAVVTPLRRARVTAERLASLLANTDSKPELQDILKREWGLTDATEEETRVLLDAHRRSTDAAAILSRMISRRSHLGWTTNGHTGADVYLFAYGPGHPKGLVENTAIGAGMASFLGIDFSTLQNDLYVDARQSLTQHGYSVRFDRTDPRNGLLVVEKGARRLVLPWAKNLVVDEREVLELDGLVVFAEKLDRVFVPARAIELIRSRLP